MPAANHTDAANADRNRSAAIRTFRPVGFIERLGAALLTPRNALAEADELDAAGRAGTDLAALIGLVFLATHTREITYAIWVGAAESLRAGAVGLAGALSRAVAMDLALLFIAAFALTITAGKKRAMGRDFDLACVTFIPLLSVRLVAELTQKLSGVEISGTWESVVAAVAYGWSGYLLLLCWSTTRARSMRDLVPNAERSSSTPSESSMREPGEGS